MQEITEPYEPLLPLVLSLTENTNCRICIQDVSGEYANIIDALPYEYKFHVGPVCLISKAVWRGMNICSKCKFRAIDHARLADKAYIGACEYGLYEVVRPVYTNNKISCMIYVGNLLYREKQFIRRAQRNGIITGIPPEAITAKLPELCDARDGDFTPYLRRAEIIHSYIWLLARLLAEKFPQDIKHPSAGNHLISRIVEYTDRNYSEPLSIQVLAKTNYVSENYLGRLFKKEMGISFSEYLNSVRIRAACVRLRETRDEIIGIAGIVGYDNVTYFNRRFKLLTELTPKQYRKKYENDGRP